MVGVETYGSNSHIVQMAGVETYGSNSHIVQMVGVETYSGALRTTPINSLAVPSPSLGICQYNKLDMRTFCEQNCTIVSTVTPLHSISAGSTFYPWG